MTETYFDTKAELLSAIDAGWNALSDALGRLTPEQLTGPTDAQGWTGKDHIAHLAAWERSMLFVLAGKPRHAGLGVPEALYLSGDFDVINAAIQEQSRVLSLADAQAELGRVHRELRAVLEGLTDAELFYTYSHYLPDEPGDDDGSPIIDRLVSNTSAHFAEHLPWIAVLTGV